MAFYISHILKKPIEEIFFIKDYEELEKKYQK